MPAYMTISVGPSALAAVPIIASHDDRLVQAALAAIHAESARMVTEAPPSVGQRRERIAHPRLPQG